MISADGRLVFRLLVQGIFCIVIFAGSANARLLDITLSELVQRSTFIAVGRTEGQQSNNVVNFAPSRVLKGKRSSHIHLCNSPDDSEAHDLSKLRGNYLVFAQASEGCFQPVHGISSVLIFDGDSVTTVAIADQPAKQSVSSLIEKVQELIESQLIVNRPRRVQSAGRP
jgi:hypothetical protein